MKIFLATDHAGLTLKNSVKDYLSEKGYDIEDCGAYNYDKFDDYPLFIEKAAEKVSLDPDNNRGIIFGGSGQAEMMTANKNPGIRCALFYAPAIPVEAADVSGRTSTDPFEIIRLTREHNNANMLSIGARFLKTEDALKAIEIWLKEPFSKDPRHERRLEEMEEIEKK